MVSHEFWTALPSILWVVFASVIFLFVREKVSSLLAALLWRVRSGSIVKVGPVELDAVRAVPGGELSGAYSQYGIRPDENNIRGKDRFEYYAKTHGVMLVHRLFQSNADDQLYDILIYVIPHGTNSLAGVVRVEYFFGKQWGNQIFPSENRSRGFSLVTSAFGPFLCTAEVIFNDGSKVMLYRYIDFEMGAFAPCVAQDDNKNSATR